MIEVSRAVRAAVGYLQLGLAEEAWEELEDLPPHMHMAWPVVEARIAIYQVLEKWTEARELAEAMAKQFPEEPGWWIKWASSLRKEMSVEAARGVLWEAAQVHPSVALISYNLARYAAAMGDIEEASRRLQRAFKIDPNLRKAALDDEDLAPLWGSGQVLP